jgi:hypothetical protein
MQIEIAIIGFNRSMSKTWPLIQNNLIKPLASQQHKLILNGVISHSKEFISYERTGENHFAETEIPDSDSYENLIEFDQKEIDLELEDLFQEFQSRELFNPIIRESQQPAALLNLLRYLYLQTIYIDLVDEQTELIIFIRPDLMPIDKFYFKKYLKNTKEITTPKWGHYEGHNDRFAIVPYFLAEQYFNRFYLLHEYAKTHKNLHAERFLKWTLREIPPSEQIFERMLRVRVGGFVATEEDFYIPRKYDRSKPLIESAIYELMYKVFNYKRRYITRPFFKFDVFSMLRLRSP